MASLNKFGTGSRYPIIVSIDFGSAEMKTIYHDTRNHKMDLDLYSFSVHTTACLYNSKTELVAVGKEASKNRHTKGHTYQEDFKRKLQRISEKDVSMYTKEDQLTIKASADLLRYSVDYITYSIENSGLTSASDNSDHCYVLSLSLADPDLVHRIVLQSGIVSERDWSQRLLLVDECFTASYYFKSTLASTANPVLAESVDVICDLGAAGLTLCAYQDQPGATTRYEGQKEVFWASCVGNAAIQLWENIKECLLQTMFGDQKYVAKEKYAAEMSAMMENPYNTHGIEVRTAKLRMSPSTHHICQNFGNEKENALQFWIPPNLYDAPEICCQDQFVTIRSSFVTKPGGKELKVLVEKLRESSFDPLCKEVGQFLKEQLFAIQKSYKINRVMLIGGLAPSQYIFDQICHTFESEGLDTPLRIEKKPILPYNVYESLYGAVYYAHEVYTRNQPLPKIQYNNSWQDNSNVEVIVSHNEYDVLMYIDIGCLVSHVYYTLSDKNNERNGWADRKVAASNIPTKLLLNQSAKDLMDLPIFKPPYDASTKVNSSSDQAKKSGKKEKLRSSLKSAFGKMKKPSASSRDSTSSEQHPSSYLSKQDIIRNCYKDEIVWGTAALSHQETSLVVRTDIHEFRMACALFLGCLNEHACSQLQSADKNRHRFAYCISVDDVFESVSTNEWRNIIITSGIASNQEDFYKRVRVLTRGEALALQNADPKWKTPLNGVFNDRSTNIVTVHVYENACHVAVNQACRAQHDSLAIVYRTAHANNAFSLLWGASVFFWDLCQTSTVPYVHQCDKHSNGTVIIDELLCDESTSLELENDEKIHRFNICRSGSCYATITSLDLLEYVLRPDVDALAHIITANLTVDGRVRTDISELKIYINTSFLSKESDYQVVCRELMQRSEYKVGSSEMKITVNKLDTDEPQHVFGGMQLFVLQSHKRIVNVMWDRTYAVRLVTPNAKIYRLDNDEKKQIKDSSELSLMIEKGTRTTFDTRRCGIRKRFYTSMNVNQFVVGKWNLCAMNISVFTALL
ncbi:hypothetical protein G6F42_008409 [Rhizopus arrhizus]|nr:hypothetical protein G6F42_008409 [Rhizopus arrhizus]